MSPASLRPPRAPPDPSIHTQTNPFKRFPPFHRRPSFQAAKVVVQTKQTSSSSRPSQRLARPPALDPFARSVRSTSTPSAVRPSPSHESNESILIVRPTEPTTAIPPSFGAVKERSRCARARATGCVDDSPGRIDHRSSSVRPSVPKRKPPRAVPIASRVVIHSSYLPLVVAPALVVIHVVIHVVTHVVVIVFRVRRSVESDG